MNTNPHRIWVNTPLFQGGKPGSSPGGGTTTANHDQEIAIMEPNKNLKVTINRRTAFDEPGEVRFKLKCPTSGDVVAEFSLSDIEFLNATMCSLAEVEATVTRWNPINFGKRKVSQVQEFKMPEHTYSTRSEVAAAEADRLCPPGWTASHYFGSQTSFFTKANEKWARGSIYRYEEIDPHTENVK